MLGWARLGALPAAALGSYLFCFFSLCVCDPEAAAGGWLGQHLLWVHPGLGGGHRGGEFSLNYQPYYVYPTGDGEAGKGWMRF